VTSLPSNFISVYYSQHVISVCDDVNQRFVDGRKVADVKCVVSGNIDDGSIQGVFIPKESQCQGNIESE